MDLHIQPNYDDFSCQWKFDVKPPPLYEDAAVMVHRVQLPERVQGREGRLAPGGARGGRG